ncbi:MAG: PIG-L family deacetylase [Clostridia bacterium]|nr:PIG-L family deacetylase [Clostridia bacterium]
MNKIIYIPDGTEQKAALRRTTHLCIAAHQDDIEFMAFAPVAECFQKQNKWFCGVVTTDGAGSPRNGIYADYTDGDMKAIRIEEQKKAAYVGGYGAQLLLGYSSKEVKDKKNTAVINDYVEILKAAKPEYVYIHNLADKHETHVATALKAIAALRRLPEEEQPEKLYGCEVWRNLDWLNDGEKVYLDCSAYPNLGRALSAVFDSQISGGKRYDLAAEGRRLAEFIDRETAAAEAECCLDFTEEERAAFYISLNKIADNMRNYYEKLLKKDIEND